MEGSALKPQAPFSAFDALDIRVGRIVTVEEARTKKPTWRITADFGATVGKLVTCGAFRRYPVEALVGRLVIGVINFGAKQMGPEQSQFLMLGVPARAGQGDTVFLTTETEVDVGTSIF